MAVGTAAALIAGISALIGTGVSAAGASQTAEAGEELTKKAEAKRKKEFQEQIQLERRKQNMKGLEFLAGQRGAATVASRQRSFWKDLVKAGERGI